MAIALGAALVSLTGLALPLYMGLAARQSVTAAADASALAAADVASGRLPGYPCALAARVANANGAVLDSCIVDGLIVTVTVVRSILGIPASAAATAGPPRRGPD